MIFGDTLLLTRKGIEVNSKVLETIGVFEGAKVHILPLRTFEHRTIEPGYKFPLDLFVTPIHPKAWPFVLRFELRLYNNARALERAYMFFYKMGINILFSESTRSGHHHIVLNVLGSLKRLEGKTIKEMYEELKSMKGDISNATWRFAVEKYINEGKSKSDGNSSERITSFNDFCRNPCKTEDEKVDNLKDEKRGTRNEILGEKLGEWYQKLYGITDENIKSADNSVQNILYEEVNRLRPLIRKFREQYRDKAEELYNKVEKELIPLKELLNFILYYKQKLIDKFEILLLKDSLINDENNSLVKKNNAENYDLDLTNIQKYHLPKEEIYIYNLKHYDNLITHTSYFKEWFLTDIASERINLVSDIIIHANNCVKKDIKNGNLKKVLNGLLSKVINQKSISKEVISKMKKLGCDTRLITKVKDYHYEEIKNNLIEAIKQNKKELIKTIEETSDYVISPTILKKFFSKIINNEDLIDEGENNFIQNWNALLYVILHYIRILPSGRKKIQKNKSRIDLDPIVITPVESLNHAYYHLAYHKDFTVFAGTNRIPFLEKDSINYPVGVFEEYFTGNQQTTFAVTSRNTDDLTLRLSPIPQIEIGNLFYIILKSYRRNCFRECTRNGLEEFGRESIFDLKKMEDLSLIFNEKECKGTSRGLVYGLTKAINILGKGKIHILRVYNQKKYNMSEAESGSIKFLVRKEGNFSLELFKDNLIGELKCTLENIGVSKHLIPGSIEIARLTAGRVFISIPFNHPMTNTWIDIIKEEAINFGLEAIEALTYTDSVTSNVKEKIKESDAMIVIFAKEIQDIENVSNLKNYDPVWLEFENFVAYNEIPVVRLIDKKSVRQSDIRIARDTPKIDFSVVDPESEFRKKVSSALEILRDKLGDRLGYR